jgi:hypothetical protein
MRKQAYNVGILSGYSGKHKASFQKGGANEK